MEQNDIKQILKKNLNTLDKENFNHQIIQKLNLDQKKRRQILFDEKSILNWFVFIAAFVLLFYLQEESQLSDDAIWIGCFISMFPIFLLIFNKIYLLKNKI